MANTSITMDNLRQIIRLKSEGTSNRKISQLLSIHRETVRKYVEQMEALGIDYGTLLVNINEFMKDTYQAWRLRNAPELFSP